MRSWQKHVSLICHFETHHGWVEVQGSGSHTGALISRGNNRTILKVLQRIRWTFTLHEGSMHILIQKYLQWACSFHYLSVGYPACSSKLSSIGPLIQPNYSTLVLTTEYTSISYTTGQLNMMPSTHFRGQHSINLQDFLKANTELSPQT